MRQMFFALAAMVAMMLATHTSAHVRWFVDGAATVEAFQPYSITDIEVIVWIAIAIGLVATSIALDMRLPTVRVVGSKTRHDFIELLRVFTGLSML